MDKKNRGLADMQEGDIILNESGTFISSDKVEGVDIPVPKNEPEKEEHEKKKDGSSAGPEEKDITD